LDEEEDFVQETPEGALVAAHAYLLTTQPEPGDPREQMHQATIKSIGLVEDRLRKRSPEKKTTRYEDKEKKSIKYQSSQSQTSDSSGDEKCKGTKGGCKEYHSTNKGEQSTPYVEGRKL
jgi:hypothetical protein